MSIKFNGLKIRVSLVQILVPAPFEFLDISGGYSILTVTAFFIVNNSVSCRYHEIGQNSGKWSGPCAPFKSTDLFKDHLSGIHETR